MLLIKNATVIDPASGLNEVRSLLIRDGVFQSPVTEEEVSRILSESEDGKGGEDLRVIDASGLIAAPGLVDTHSHFRDPGFTYKEDITTGAAAAARGGYTSIIMMANTKPPVDSVETLTDLLARAENLPVHLYSAANVTCGMAGKELSDMAALKEAGAIVFTDDGKPVLDEALFEKALLTAKDLSMPVSVHEEDPAFISENGINGGGSAARYYGIRGSSREAEISMIRRDVELAVKTGAKLLIQHISTAEGVDLVRQARKENPLIAAEATPHHFSLTEDAVIKRGSLAKVNPPLRTEKDRLAIIEGLADGTIGIIATDHAPHAAEEKERPLTEAPSGLIGLETALGLAIRELVKPGFMTMEHMLKLLTVNPADYYGLPAGRIAKGAPADLVLFDPDAVWTVTEAFASRSHNSPFTGEKLPGAVRMTIAGGKIIYSV